LARIALDAMGGDFAPHAPVSAALLALAELDQTHTIQLVGRSAVIAEQLDALVAGEHAALAAHRARIEVVEAPDVIEMADKPTAVLKKPNCSMAVGIRLQAEGHSDAFVSAGNTGAQMAASAVLLKLHGNLKRPAIGTIFPTERQPIVVLDSGANVDCSADELVQFARIGAVYAEDMMGRRNPAIGLLSIGEEPEKGNAVVKEAHLLLQAAGLNFQGNVEGRDIPVGRSDRGDIDVVVCDGFVGNVLLKFYEQLAPTLFGMVAERLGLSRDEIQSKFKELDHSEHGGAPLLGVRGVSIISHGKSSPRALKNAVKMAVRAHESRMSDHIGRRLGGSASEGGSVGSTSGSSTATTESAAPRRDAV
jgi:glycerol-3-phosphate acyltransferase PlsX